MCARGSVCVLSGETGKKKHLMFARGEVDMTIWFSVFHMIGLLVAIGLCF